MVKMVKMVKMIKLIKLINFINLTKLIKRRDLSPAPGFTLLEIVVSMGIFFAVIIIAIGAVLSINRAHIKASNLQVIQDNVRFSMEFMTKELRSGSNYSVSGASQINFDDSAVPPNRIGYCLRDDALYRLTDGATDCSDPDFSSQVTGDDIIVDRLNFLLVNTASEGGTNPIQPRITIAIQAHSADTRLATSFTLETTITQRQR